MSAISSIASSIPTTGTPGTPGAVRRSDDATGTAAPNIQTGESNPFAEVTSEEWLGIILEELSNQDPFEPNDTSATLEQLNSLRSIESDLSLQDQLESLVLQNSIGQAGSLIGKQVEGLGTDGLNVTGLVDSVRVVEGKSQLQLQNGSTVEFGNVTNVANPPTPPPELAAQAATATTPVPATAPAGTVPINGNTPEVDALTAALSGLTDTLNASTASTR